MTDITIKEHLADCPYCNAETDVGWGTVELAGGIIACPKCERDFEVIVKSVELETKRP